MRTAQATPQQGDDVERSLLQRLRHDFLFLGLLLLLVVLVAAAPQKIPRLPSLVDWPTVAALTGLLTLTKALELSAAMERFGHLLVLRLTSQRAMATGLVAAAALLSTVLTNDVALFVLVPLTLDICRVAKMPATRLIVFEALAVNAGSALTPIGNPQNLFLWHLSGVSFGGFVLHMLPLVALSMLLLLVLTACVFGRQPLRLDTGAQAQPLDRTLLWVSLGLYLPFLLATGLHHAAVAAAAVLLVFALLRPQVLARLDWGLLLVFVLMFVDLRLLAGLDSVRHAIDGAGLAQATHLYLAGVAASQLVSNVPAAIALAEYSKDWRVIAYGVNVGGFGLLIGSLANLIALRLSGDRKAWIGFHLFSIPALAVSGVLGYAILFLWHRA